MPLDNNDQDLIKEKARDVLDNQEKIIELGEQILEEIRRKNDLEEQRQKEEEQKRREEQKRKEEFSH